MSSWSPAPGVTFYGGTTVKKMVTYDDGKKQKIVQHNVVNGVAERTEVVDSEAADKDELLRNFFKR